MRAKKNRSKKTITNGQIFNLNEKYTDEKLIFKIFLKFKVVCFVTYEEHAIANGHFFKFKQKIES